MTPDATPERDTAEQEARLAARAHLLVPCCADCGRAIPQKPYACEQHPDALVLYRTVYHHVARSRETEPSYLTWGNATVVMIGFAVAWALALLVLGG